MAGALVGTPQTGVDFQTPTGLSYTAETGSDRIVVLAGYAAAAGTRSISSLTWAGGAMSSDLNAYTNSNVMHAYIGYAKETLATGAQDFALSWSGTTTHAGLAAAMTLSGIDQTTPVRSATSTDGTTSTNTHALTGASVVDGDFCVLAIALHSAVSVSSVSSGWTEQYDVTIGTDRVAVYTKAISADGTETPTVNLGANSTGAFLMTVFQGAGAPSLVTKLKLLAHSSAASASSVVGAVFAAPTGSDITGAKIGEFTGQAFEASLESGQAVLKVPVADFGGGSLTTSDTPVALARNGTNTTGIVSCTVIEE